LHKTDVCFDTKRPAGLKDSNQRDDRFNKRFLDDEKRINPPCELVARFGISVTVGSDSANALRSAKKNGAR
jgi:hypothetical protein